MPPPTSRFLEVDGLRLHVACHPGPKQGAALLLAHGSMAHTGWWQPLADQLQQHLRVFALDRRGHGRSDHAPLEKYGWEPDLCDAEAVAKQLDRGPWILAGHSQGGLLSLYLAVRQNIPVTGLILLDSPLHPRAPSLMQVGASLRRIPQLRYPSLDHAVRRFQPYPRPHRVSPDVLQAIARDSFRKTPEGDVVSRFDWKRFRAEEPTPHPLASFSEYLSRLEVPTLLLRGEDSSILSPQDYQDFITALPHGRGVEIRGTTHSLHAEQPHQVAKEILGFIATLPQTRN